MNKVLIIGGTSGLGLSIALNLVQAEKVFILGRIKPKIILPKHIEYIEFDLSNFDTNFFDSFCDIDALIYCAGVGQVKSFDKINEDEILNILNVNTLGFFRIINYYKFKLFSTSKFHAAVIGSIAGFVSSPLFSVYSASKAAVRMFVESVNVELQMKNCDNIIVHIAPGYLEGTGFYGEENNLDILKGVTNDIIEQINNDVDLYIPNFDEVYKSVINNYNQDFRKFGIDSYKHKLNRLKIK